MTLQRRLNFEALLYMIAFALAIMIRFYNLGNAPLSDSEAEWALQALNTARVGSDNGRLMIGPNPGYVLLTSVLFAMFESTNFLARFWPALAGSLVVFFPYLISRHTEPDDSSRWNIERWAAILLAFGLALTPGLVTVSRQAGGPMMGLAFGVLALGLWNVRRPVLAGISAGLALISGPALFLGALGLLLAWIAVKVAFRKGSLSSSSTTEEHTQTTDPDITTEENKAIGFIQLDDDWQQFLISTGAAILVIGTLFLIYPHGLAAWFGSLTAFFEGWIKPSGVAASRVLAAGLVYELLVIVFSLLFIIRTLLRHDKVASQNRNRMYPLFILWAVFGLILILLYPDRQVHDLIWVLVPLWVLAASELSEHVLKKPLNVISIIQAVFLLVLSSLLWYTIASTTRTPSGLPEASMQYAIIIGILALGVLTTALVSLGWSWDISRSGLILGVSAALVIYSISVLWGSAQTRHNQPQELWSPLPAPGQSQLMKKVLHEVSTWNTGFPEHIDIISTVDSPSLRWVLREFPNTRYILLPDSDELPSIVITRGGEDIPPFAASYRGEDFVWWSNPGWSGGIPPDPAKWFAFREAPLVSEKIIMWTRSDLFLDTSMEAETFIPASSDPADEGAQIEFEEPVEQRK